MTNARAFTLVELLVSIAIIALLLGVLLPSLATARQTAQAITCAAQARALQTANDLYADDHDDHYVPGAPDFLENKARWHGTRASLSQAFDPARAPLTPYTDTLDLVTESCPSFETTRSGFEQGSGAYGYNNAFVGTHRAFNNNAWHVVTDEQGTPRHRFRSPTRTLAFADAAFPDQNAPDLVAEYSFAEPRFNAAYPDDPSGFRMDPSIHFRHTNQTANLIMLDGHAAPEHLAFSWSSGFYAPDARTVALGWFDSPDDNSAFDPR